MTNDSLEPIIFLIDDNEIALNEFEERLCIEESSQVQEMILHYPTIYIHNLQESNEYEVYVGESGHVIQRTKEHYREARDDKTWQCQFLRNRARLFFIGHPHFNKSLTLDLENRLMHYMMGIDAVRKIHNKKGNPQDKYYTDDEFDRIFHKVWARLRKEDPVLFPVESKITDSAIFKASPLHKLTPDQETAKELIIQKIMGALDGNETNQVIFIQGEAGTGKTVLNSSTFFELLAREEELGLTGLQCFLMVNHDEQIVVYQQIAEKLGVTDTFGKVICKPTPFINRHTKEKPVDVAFIDEAHLLLTQGKQSYRGKNQLRDIIERAKVTVVMFDENQILTAEQYMEAQDIEKYKSDAIKNNLYIELKNQLRMMAAQETIDWIDSFTKDSLLKTIPKDDTGYEVRIFDQPKNLEKEIRKKGATEDTALSRIIATYDWNYSEKKPHKNRMLRYWEVAIDTWHKPWNNELKKEMSRKQKAEMKSISWAEQPQTINEVGSTFTIQGFDLSYAGVILGPSVKYRNGKIVIDPDASCNKKAVQRRTLSDGTKKKFGEVLIKHEVRVLMTRGVKGLYIYACDEELRKALKEAAVVNPEAQNYEPQNIVQQV